MARTPHDEHLDKQPNVIERFFNRIKHCRRIATRYEKTALASRPLLARVAA